MVDPNAQVRLKRLCKALDIPVDDDLLADPDAHFAIYGQLCRVAERWKKERAIRQAATSDAPSAMTDEQIIERMKSLGINWTEGGRGEFGYAIGSFDRMSMNEARALLQTVPKGDGND